MTSARERLLAALEGRTTDRLPATTHELMRYFLDKYMQGATHQQFFDHFGLDSILWTAPYRADASIGEYLDPSHKPTGSLEGHRVASDQWRVEAEEVPGQEYRTTRYRFVTPKGSLAMVLQSNEYTSWVTERPVKRKEDIELIAAYATAPKCDVDAVNQAADQFGDRGIVRGTICGFDVYGQPGCWQDAACLFGIQDLILATYDDPKWVHEFLAILERRKEVFVRSLQGAHYDLIETGGGDASSTVISPRLLDEFVAPYDSRLIELAHQAGQRVVYHTCGGMMPILERIADMGPDAMETFAPPEMGGDVNLREAKRRIGDRVCMIGGFDQFHFFQGCTPEQTRAEVRRCFDEVGTGGGYILSPSDHFFDADLDLIAAFADEAKQCRYE